MVVKYKEGISGCWFYYSIGNLDYAVIYRNKREFLKAKGWNDVEFEKIK